jgi:hypothetical protein
MKRRSGKASWLVAVWRAPQVAAGKVIRARQDAPRDADFKRSS